MTQKTLPTLQMSFGFWFLFVILFIFRNLKMRKYKRFALRVGRDGSVGKVLGTQTWLQIPSTHVKSQA